METKREMADPLKALLPLEYYQLFLTDPHPYVSRAFIETHAFHCEKVLYLASSHTKSKLGLVVGIKDGFLCSPFSAPFGGFHSHNQRVSPQEIDLFLEGLKQFCALNNFKGFRLTLPPSIYHQSLNAKLINSLLRFGAHLDTPEVTSWIDLQTFSGEFTQKETRRLVRKSEALGLILHSVQSDAEKELCFGIIADNRGRNGRPLYMGLDDMKRVEAILPVDYFLVKRTTHSHADTVNQNLAAAIFYRGHHSIVQAIFWGDSAEGRDYHTMNFLASQLWNHYREEGYAAIDLGISTESGEPNNGLLHFKEAHDAISAPRFSFRWDAQ